MPTVLRAMFIAVLLTVLPIGTAVWLAGEGEPEPTPPPAYQPTDLADYDTTTVTIARAGFCERLPADAVELALDTEPAAEDAWSNGDEARLTGTEGDLAHEYGCLYGGGRARAAAWVFAPPVTPDAAQELATTAASEQGCERAPAGAAYGAQGVALLCRSEGAVEASYRGLFGDAWLTCTLTVRGRIADAALLERTGQWCVAVAEAARTA